MLAGMGVDPGKVKTATEKGATVLNLARMIKLLANELSFEALGALPRLTKDSFTAEAYERAVSTAKESSEAQQRRETDESLSDEATVIQ